MPIFKDFKDIGTKNNGLRFSLKVSNGKNETTGEWKNQRLPTARLLEKWLKKQKKNIRQKMKYSLWQSITKKNTRGDTTKVSL